MFDEAAWRAAVERLNRLSPNVRAHLALRPHVTLISAEPRQRSMTTLPDVQRLDAHAANAAY